MGDYFIPAILATLVIGVAVYAYYIMNKRTPYIDTDRAKTSLGKGTKMTITVPFFFLKSDYGRFRVAEQDPEENRGVVIFSYNKKDPMRVKISSHLKHKELFSHSIGRNEMKEFLKVYRDHAPNESMGLTEQERNGVLFTPDALERHITALQNKQKNHPLHLTALYSDIAQGLAYPLLTTQYGSYVVAIPVPYLVFQDIVDEWYKMISEDEEEKILSDEMDKELRSLLEAEKKRP